MLEAQGLASWVRDEHLVTQDWLLSNAVGGVRLEVAEGDVEAARAALQSLDQPAGPLACPACESTAVEARSRSRLGTVGWVVVVVLTGGLALLFLRPRYRCQACGRQWS